jgi:phospholipid/cholesterol/gamma-HCH transport system ATP-binding protein
MDVFDNVAFPLREHTNKTEREIREIVMEKLELVGLTGHENKLPGAVSGGMRKRAGLARGMVLDPEIMLFDEPDSGLDPVRTAYLNQLIVDLNERTDSTFLIVTHNIDTAQTLPDNIGIIYHKHLAMFGPREQLLTSEDAVVSQFLNGRREGPIGMSEEKDASEQAAEKAGTKSELALPAMKPQLTPTNGNPRKAEARRKERVMGMMNQLTPAAQAAVRESLGDTGNGGRANGGDRGYPEGGYAEGGYSNGGYSGDGGRGYDPRHRADRQR